MMSFETFMAVAFEVLVVWDVTPCSDMVGLQTLRRSIQLPSSRLSERYVGILYVRSLNLKFNLSSLIEQDFT